MRSFEEESACAGAKKAFTSSEELLCPKIRPGDSDTPNTATCKPTEQTIAARNPREIFPVEIGCGRIPGKRLDTGKFLEYQKTLANLMNNAGIWNRMTTDGMFGRMNG